MSQRGDPITDVHHPRCPPPGRRETPTLPDHRRQRRRPRRHRRRRPRCSTGTTPAAAISCCASTTRAPAGSGWPATASTGRTDLDPTNPLGVPDESIMLFGSPIWDRMRRRPSKGEVRRHQLAWQFSPVPPRRAGRADVHGEDRQHRPADRLEVLRRHPGDRRGPPRRGVQPLPPREARADLSDQPEPAPAARRRPVRRPLGLHLPHHAGAHRRPRPGRVRADPQHGHRPARPGHQRLRDAGRSPPRHVRPPRPARLLRRAQRAPSATSASSSPSTRCT